MIITLTIVILVACFILFSTQKISKNLSNYFPNVNCEELISDLQNREDMLQTYAYYEWSIFMTMDKNHFTVEQISTNNLHCYCDNLWKKLGYLEASKVEHTMFTTIGDGQDVVKGYVCGDYMSYTFIISAFKVLIPVIVIGLNVAIKTITQWLVKWIGYETKS